MEWCGEALLNGGFIASVKHIGGQVRSGKVGCDKAK